MNLPQQIPSSIAPVLVLPPEAQLFARRAARLRTLAPGHALERWFGWLAELVEAQQHEFDTLIKTGDAGPLANWTAIFERLSHSQPELAALSAEVLETRGERALQFARGELAGAGRDRTDLVISAALQVAWTLAARKRLAAGSVPIQHHHQCPCCGSAALGGVVMAGEGRGGLRYLECALCATRWHAVRAHCSLCDSDGVVDYLALEGESAAVQAETCNACSGYIKLFFQARDPALDPLADDLATLVLDVLVGEQGYARGAPNLFLVTGDVV
jgi:FdhE protein